MQDPVHIRMAVLADADALLSIYRPYVEHTPITFEYTVPSSEEFGQRIARTLERYPYLVAEIQGRPAGYAYASPFKTRAAYDWSVETSVYVDQEARGRGLGTLLYGRLEELLARQHILNVNACITWPNPDSIRFHERLGYRIVAHFTKCGYKLGRWYDMVWMEKMLGEHPDQPEAVIPVGQLGQLQ